MRRIHLSGKPLLCTDDREEYAFGQDQIAVIYRAGVPARLVRNCEIATTLGVDVYGGVPQLVTADPGGQPSLLFRHERGRSLGALCKERPLTIIRFARVMAAHHKLIHEKTAPAGLRSQRDHVRAKIAAANDLDARSKRLTLSLLNNMPEDDRLCHGDLGLVNTYLADGRTCSNRWQDMNRGNPLCDVARTSLLFTSALGGFDLKSRLVRAFLRIGNSAYLKAYALDTRARRNEFLAWRVINAAARLGEDVGCKPLLARIVRADLPKAVSRFS